MDSGFNVACVHFSEAIPLTGCCACVGPSGGTCECPASQQSSVRQDDQERLPASS